MLYPELSTALVDSFFKVHYDLGPGLLEGCYHKALFLELKEQGFETVSQAPFSVYYRGQSVGDYFADLLVNNLVVIEVKAVSSFLPVHEAQVLNYLRISGLRLGFLVNFGGARLVWRRLVLSG